MKAPSMTERPLHHGLGRKRELKVHAPQPAEGGGREPFSRWRGGGGGGGGGSTGDQ